MVKKEILVLLVSVILIMLTVIITLGLFFDTSITGRVVSIGLSEDIPQGFDLAVILIIMFIIILVGKKLNIFSNKFDNIIKIGSVRLTENDIKSEANLTLALQKANNDLNDGAYTIHASESLFARFDVKNKEIKLHRYSENTGILMPCWNHFKE